MGQEPWIRDTRPTITGIDPPEAMSGEEVTISGENFGSSGTVTFSDVEAGAATLWSSGSITIIVPDDIFMWYGDLNPVASNDTKEGCARNRCVEIGVGGLSKETY